MSLGPGDTVVGETAKDRQLPDTIERMIRPFLWRHPQFYPGKMIRADIPPAASLVRAAAVRGSWLVALETTKKLRRNDSARRAFDEKQGALVDAFHWCFGHRRSMLVAHDITGERVRVLVVLLESGADPRKVKEVFDARRREGV